MTDCVFCAMAAGRAPCHRIWEDERHLAFLSNFPNTAGFSVVITKRHYPSYAFDLPDEVRRGRSGAFSTAGSRMSGAPE
jgi:diadenosine tetraphosphate (Ap4A) HIT family hydrolase